MADAASPSTTPPPADFEVDVSPEDGGLLVEGQVLKGIFSLDSLENDPVLAGPARLFTNGLGIDLEHMVRTVVETKRDKTTLPGAYRPSTRLFAVCMLWGRRKKRHFFRDAIFAQSVFARELGLSLFDFLKLRGWSVHRATNGSVDISYRRIRECLEMQDDPSLAHRYWHFSAIMDRVYRYLNSNAVFQRMPHEKQLMEDDYLNPIFTDNNTSPDVGKQKAADDDDDEEDEDGPVLRLPTYGKTTLVDFQRQASFHGRQRREHQVLQLALSTIMTCFGPALHKARRNSKPFMEKLLSVIFRECSSRRQMLEVLQDILMSFRNQAAVTNAKPLIRSWLKKPSIIPTLARQCNSSLPHADYLNDLSEALAQKFRVSSSIDHRYRSLEREQIIVRMVVHIHLVQMNKANKHSTKSKHKALIGLRKEPTLVDNECSLPPVKRQKASGASYSTSLESMPPKSVLDELTGRPSLLTKIPPPQARTKLGISSTSEVANGDNPSTAAPEATEKDTIDNNPIPADDDARWDAELCVAALSSLDATCPRLVIECPLYDINLHHAPLEMYLAWDLQEYSHCFVSGARSSAPVYAGPTLILPSIGSAFSNPPYLSVARPGAVFFDECFGGDVLAFDLKVLVKFVMETGSSDPNRSSPSKVGSRLDFGNGGLAMDTSSTSFRPKTLCGTDSFDRYSQGELARAILGRLLDAMTQCMNRMTANAGRPSSMNHKRFVSFAQHLQKFLYAKELTFEWVTLQLLNISEGQQGRRHKDTHNDPREIYNRHTCLSVFFLDGCGCLWSLKILAGFRKRIGDYMVGGPYSRLLSLKSRLLMLAEGIDSKYQAVMGLYRGAHSLAHTPTWRDPSTFFLDDYMPFQEATLANGSTQLYFPLVTGTTRSYWLSTALTCVYRLSPRLDMRGVIQLAVMASWQNSFHHFWEVAKLLQELPSFSLEYPLLDYYQACLKLFHGATNKGSEFIGGDNARYSPVGFKFGDVFPNERLLAEEKVDCLVDILQSLLQAVDAASTMGSTTRLELQKLLQETSDRLKESMAVELGQFRLLVFIQFCCHLRVVLRSGRYIRHLLYPVAGAASYEHILHHGFLPEQVDTVCEMLQDELSIPGRPVHLDEVETMLCESKEGRLLTKVDVFVKGQALFRLDDEGVPWIKEYGEYCWSRVKIRYRN